MVSLLMAVALAHDAFGAVDFRPPAVPLVAHDPYFSIWSPADRLTDTATVHWTGKPHPLKGLIYIDGVAFRFMGAEPANYPALPQADVIVRPTRTVYLFTNKQIRLELTFTTPALPDDLEILARPVTYLTWEVRSADSAPHAVRLEFAFGPELAVDTPDQPVEWARPAVEGLMVWRAGAKIQRVLARPGDDLRIEWGYAYLAAPNEQQPEAGDPGVIRFDLVEVGALPVSRFAMLAYDDLYSINYFWTRLRPYWRRNGAEAADLLKAARHDYEELAARCRAFDEALTADLTRAGGKRYALLCALAYRQTIAGNKLVADTDGKPLLFPKETFNGGCIGTVDVLFAQAPLFLAFSPELTRAMLVPVLNYASSPRWTYSYVPQNLGIYPFAAGQTNSGFKGPVPVEDIGDMLIMLAALARREGDAKFAERWWPTISKWATHLVANGLDPENKLSAAEFGFDSYHADQVLQAIIGIGGYARLCELAGKKEEAVKHRTIARDFAAKWTEMAMEDGRNRLVHTPPSFWGLKHNLIWDRVLGLNLIPESVGDQEIKWILKVRDDPYGPPINTVTESGLIDWTVWSIAVAREPKEFEALLKPIFLYVHQTPTRVPLANWFDTANGTQRGYQASPAVGGVFIRLLSDPDLWAKWADRAASTPRRNRDATRH